VQGEDTCGGWVTALDRAVRSMQPNGRCTKHRDQIILAEWLLQESGNRSSIASAAQVYAALSILMPMLEAWPGRVWRHHGNDWDSLARSVLQ
jgi:hypothetical protein